ncbi:hypothetical protein DVH05_008637 [Phytophthora capsici]|nr:hypothetical protein DVH05_008637 [Phytophthora capsici]
MNGEDAGDMVGEYQQNYMTKEGAGLKNAAAVMLTALEDAIKYPSVAAPIRQAQYLATRTVNAFGGAHEWPLSLMVYALLGHKSYVSSETFWYLFPHGFIDELRQSKEDDCGDVATNECDSKSSSENESMGGDMEDADFMDIKKGLTNVPAHQAIEELADFANSEDLSFLSSSVSDRHTTGGARSYKIDGNILFITQVESYKYRGIHFVEYSPVEFACIVDIVPRKTPKTGKSQRGRKFRKFGSRPSTF